MVNFQPRELDRVVAALDRLTADAEAMEIDVRAGKAGTIGE
jgi:hypothetical protein